MSISNIFDGADTVSSLDGSLQSPDTFETEADNASDILSEVGKDIDNEVKVADAPVDNSSQRQKRLVVVTAGASDPSTTRMLADRVAERSRSVGHERNMEIITQTIDIRELAGDITSALLSQVLSPKLQAAVDALGQADGLIASAPVYKAAPNGLFTSFFQVLDNDLLIGKPIILAATAGTERHALVIDESMRSLFAFFRTLTVPTGIFAASNDWNNSKFGKRINRAALELVLLMELDFEYKVREGSWENYQHSFGSAGGTERTIDINTDLMKLAAGGNSYSSPSKDLS